MIRLSLIIVVAAVTSAASAVPDDVIALRWLDHADVKADFHRAVEELHDTRFLRVGTIATYIPAGQYDPKELVAKYGSRNFAIGCLISGPEALRLRKKADAYADGYNQMLVRYLRARR